MKPLHALHRLPYLSLLLALLLAALAPPTVPPVKAAASDLFFSEYVEGSSWNKALEIYNGTGTDIDLEAGNYSVVIYSNGYTSPTVSITLTGTVSTGDAFVLVSARATQDFKNRADQIESAFTWFNGNDAVALKKGGTTLDVIGKIGEDPGEEWGTDPTSTKDNTLRRKSNICSGDPNGGDTFDPATEWEGFLADTFGGLGSHSANCNDPPTISPINNQSTDEDNSTAPIPFTIGDDLTPAGNLTLLKSSSDTTLLPEANINFGSSGANRTVTLTPAPNCSGSAHVTITVRDSGGLTAQTTFRLTVNPVNDPPSFTGGGDQTVDEDSGPQSVKDWATNISPGPYEGGQSLTFILNNDNNSLFSSQPAIDADGDGELTYTPAPDANGSALVRVRLRDDGGGDKTSSPQTFEITVNPVNDPPLARADHYTTAEDAPLHVAPADGLLRNDFDADDDPLSATLLISPTGGTLDLAPDGGLIFTPTLDFHGAVSFTYCVSDGLAFSAPATVTITITPVNDPPIARADHYTTAEDVPLHVAHADGLLRNDFDADDDPLSATLLISPTGGTLALAPDGGLIFTPTLDFHGAVSFTYRVSDGLAFSEPATVTITITPVNDPPLARADHYTTAEDAPLHVIPADGLLSNDSDADGDTINATLLISPTSGKLDLAPDGGLIFTPTLDFHGAVSFTYCVSDGLEFSAPATVTITITPTNDPPVFLSKPVNAFARVGMAYTHTLAAFDVDEGDRLTITAPLLPGWLTLTANGDNSATLDGTPAKSDVGKHATMLQVRDSAGLTDTHSFTISVSARPLTKLHLPLLVKNHLVAPDLVVEQITVTGEDVRVAIANRGNGPASEEFWVDFYVDPAPAPNTVNQMWHELAEAGLAWEVTAALLPLEPGEALTLTLGDEHYRPQHSHLPGLPAAGTPVYAQVDSYNAATTYGAVLEGHEIMGRAYNNVTGTLISPTAAGGSIRAGMGGYRTAR